MTRHRQALPLDGQMIVHRIVDIREGAIEIAPRLVCNLCRTRLQAQARYGIYPKTSKVLMQHGNGWGRRLGVSVCIAFWQLTRRAINAIPMRQIGGQHS